MIACFFSASKSCPAIANSFFAASRDSQPSIAGAAHVLVGRHEIEPLAQIALDDGERIAGRPGLVHDQDAGRALARALLVLVGPAAVVGHRLAAERLRIELDGSAGSGTGGSLTSTTIVLPFTSTPLKSFQSYSGASTP